MKFTAEEIKKFGSLEEEGTLNTEALLGKPPNFLHYQSPVSVLAQATYQNGQVSMDISFKTTFKFTCGRCLETFEKPIEDRIKQVIPLDQSFIDIDYIIKEALLLSLPLNAVCRENCQGLCHLCGANKNIMDCQCNTKTPSGTWTSLNKMKLRPISFSNKRLAKEP